MVSSGRPKRHLESLFEDGRLLHLLIDQYEELGKDL